MSVTEPPFGRWRSSQATGEPLAAHQPGHRRVDVLEQRVQRAHRDRVGASDRRRPELADPADGCAHSAGSRRASPPAWRRGSWAPQARPPPAAARARRWRRRTRPPPRAWAARARARSCSGRAAAPVRCRRAAGAPSAPPAAGTPRARGRAGTAASACGTPRRSRRRSAAGRPTARRRRACSASRRRPRHRLDPLATRAGSRGCPRGRHRGGAHHRPAAMAEERRGGTVDEHQVADRPAGDRCREVAPACGQVACTSNARCVAARISDHESSRCLRSPAATRHRSGSRTGGPDGTSVASARRTFPSLRSCRRTSNSNWGAATSSTCRTTRCSSSTARASARSAPRIDLHRSRRLDVLCVRRTRRRRRDTECRRLLRCRHALSLPLRADGRRRSAGAALAGAAGSAHRHFRPAQRRRRFDRAQPAVDRA